MHYALCIEKPVLMFFCSYVFYCSADRASFLIGSSADGFATANRPAGDVRFKTSSIASQFLIPNF